MGQRIRGNFKFDPAGYAVRALRVAAFDGANLPPPFPAQPQSESCSGAIAGGGIIIAGLHRKLALFPQPRGDKRVPPELRRLFLICLIFHFDFQSFRLVS